MILPRFSFATSPPPLDMRQQSPAARSITAQYPVLWYWLPPVLWMGTIFVFSTDLLASGNTGGTIAAILRWFAPDVSIETIDRVNFVARKGAHFTTYAVLALLLFRAFRAGAPRAWRRQWALWSLFIVSLYALVDEYHQTFTHFRTGSFYDSLLDMVGGATSLTCLWIYRKVGGIRPRG
ncbi:MAG: VanZ family protein [Blastocatellia bacterium]